MRRGKDAEWDVYDTRDNVAWEKVSIIVLMDIRDELKRLNGLLHCQNFIDIPRRLNSIRLNTAKRRKVSR